MLYAYSLPRGDYDKAFQITNMSAFRDGYSYNIIGILKNISTQNQSDIQIVVQMFDAMNNLMPDRLLQFLIMRE
jgi:hypothetical protein